MHVTAFLRGARFPFVRVLRGGVSQCRDAGAIRARTGRFKGDATMLTRGDRDR